MTIAGRNKTQLIAIAAMIVLSVVSIVLGIMFFVNNNIENIAEIKSLLRQNFFLTSYQPPAVALSIIVFPILSLIFLIFIYNMFKTTHAVEISFFVAFIFAIGFESLRLIFAASNLANMLSENISLISRVVYFFRLSAIFALFVSSVFAIKVMSRQISYVLFAVFFVAFLLTVSMPINNIQVNKFFLFGDDNSYPYKFILFFGSFVACVNYFIAYALKNSKVYLKAALGISILVIGYWFMVYTSTYLFLLLGLPIFVLGSILFVVSIHTYHLWE